MVLRRSGPHRGSLVPSASLGAMALKSPMAITGPIASPSMANRDPTSRNFRNRSLGSIRALK